jgi:hypothetical protein
MPQLELGAHSPIDPFAHIASRARNPTQSRVGGNLREEPRPQQRSQNIVTGRRHLLEAAACSRGSARVSPDDSHLVGTVNLSVFGVIRVAPQHSVPPANRHDPAV